MDEKTPIAKFIPPGFFAFWWKCIKDSREGAASFANDWTWVFGTPLLAPLLVWVERSAGHPTVLIPDHPIIEGVVIAALTFLVTLIAHFVIKVLRVPVATNNYLSNKIYELEGHLARELDNKRPKLSGQILQLIQGATVEGKYVCSLNLRILNKGAPTVILGWKVKLKLQGSIYEGMVFRMPPNATMNTDEGQAWNLSIANPLYEQAANNPIQNGSAITGWIMVLFDSFAPATMIQACRGTPHPEWTITIFDINNEAIDIVAGDELQHLKAPLYHPDGSGGPTLAQ
jgi:hypothetical protein